MSFPLKWLLVIGTVASALGCGPRDAPPVDTTRTLPPPEPEADLTRAGKGGGPPNEPAP